MELTTKNINTETIDMKSENMEMARRPNRSIRPPTTGETTIPGRLDNAANSPAFAADPVSSSTIHGTVIMTTPFDIPDTAFVTCKRPKARLFFTFHSVSEPFIRQTLSDEQHRGERT